MCLVIIPHTRPLHLLSCFSHTSAGSKGLIERPWEICTLLGGIALSSSCCLRQRRYLKARKGIIAKKRTFESHGSLQGLLSPEDVSVIVSSQKFSEARPPQPRCSFLHCLYRLCLSSLEPRGTLCWVWTSSLAGPRDRINNSSVTELCIVVEVGGSEL